MFTRTRAVAVAMLSMACNQTVTSDGGRTSNVVVSQAAVKELPPLTVGGPCKKDDGFQPPSIGNGEKAEVGDDGLLHPIAVDSSKVKEFPQLEPGIGYCLHGGAHPHGYFTMNCSADADCPAETVCSCDPGSGPCEGGICIRPCQDDSECQKPTRCTGADPRRFCINPKPPR
jgi:hypothetical protein